MKTSILTLLFFLATITALACDMPAGGRMGLHGMVVYGSGGDYFIDHIPMVHAPHDMQIVAKIKITDANGKDFTGDLANSTFTLKPDNNFSLNDFASGHMKLFVADIFAGSFEQEGQILQSKLNVQVQNILVARHIPAVSPERAFAIHNGDNVFEVNVITPENNFQSVKNTKTGQTLWCVKGPDFLKNCD